MRNLRVDPGRHPAPFQKLEKVPGTVLQIYEGAKESASTCRAPFFCSRLISTDDRTVLSFMCGRCAVGALY